MKTLSVKQPWSFLICSGLKDIENRTWKLPEKMKGERVLVHVSAKPWTWQAVRNYLTDAMAFEEFGFNGEWLRNLTTGAIIGSVEIVDCVINHASIWAEQSAGYSICYPNGVPASCANKKYKPIFNWVLANQVLFKEPILNVKGKLGFWDYPLDLCHVCGQPAHSICQICDEPYCDDHKASYDQFSQIDYDCCSGCAESKKHRE